jgi:hypothetical protein
MYAWTMLRVGSDNKNEESSSTNCSVRSRRVVRGHAD